MKRKLIDFDTFKKIKNESLSAAEAELRDAEDVLAKAFNVDKLSLHCYGKSDVTYETTNRNFIHASYRINENQIFLDNIEELVIDESSAKKEAKNFLSKMVEDILNNQDEKATLSFEGYLGLPNVRRALIENKDAKEDDLPFKKKKDKKKDFFGKKKDKKKDLFGKKKDDEPCFQVKAPKKMVKEWAKIAENVTNYVDFQELGPVVSQSELKRDEKGNVTQLRIPTSYARNEAKILNLTYKNMLDTELKVLRGKMKTVSEDSAFAHAMADLHHANSLSDNSKLEQVLEAIATKWPDLLYLTQTELATTIQDTFESIGENNRDDAMCHFFAEGILRTATNAYTERVNRIARLTGVELNKEHVYESFQQLVHKFYPTLDAQVQLEMQVFVDLYNAFVEVHTTARNEGNEALQAETVGYLQNLHAVLQNETEPNLELAADASSWLASLVEANVPGAEENWDVSNTPYQTKVGEHPRMQWAANQTGATASNYNGDIKGTPVSDGKSYKNGLEAEMRNNAWGNWSSEETWPGLKNPYVPKPFGDYKMKEPSAANSGDNDWSRWQSSDTWPSLQNPNQKPSPWDVGKYKMKSDNLVVDQ